MPGAELVLRGGKVYTLDPTLPQASAIAIRAGRIVGVGNSSDVEALAGSETRTVELHGRAVVPGFVDAHVHFGEFALSRQEVDLDPAPTLEDGLALLRTRADELAREPSDRWLRGRGWDRNRWGRVPTAAELDGAVGPRPAVLSSHDGHSLWLSTAALDAVGIDASTQDPAGGVIQRDERGAPSGVLFENAQDLARRRMPERTDEEVIDAIRRALPLAAAAGLTGLHNFEDARSLRAFQALERAGELTLRVYHGVPRSRLRRARELGLRTGAGDGLVRIGPVKLFSDGALGSRTAHLLEPYEGHADDYRGVPTLSYEQLLDDMLVAGDVGLDVAVHAIGDAAVRSVLDACEAARAQSPAVRERMLRIEHAQLVHPDDVPRFAGLGVIASMQPIHALADWRAADAHWGPRARHGYAWGDLQRAGARLAFGTDAPVERIEPLLTLHAATTRQGLDGEPSGGWYPHQRLRLEDAVRAYTQGSAFAERAQDRRGTLGVGKDADLLVLAPDPFEAERVLDTHVEMTLSGGRIVFDRGSSQ